MSALISEDTLYRYNLCRDVDLLLGHGTVTFICLNPSTADATQDDPTLRRCISFARTWGYARVEIVNLYAYRATDPRDLALVYDPVGPLNDIEILASVFRADVVVAAWGVNAKRDRAAAVLDLCERRQAIPRCLGVTKDGWPRHPLYVPAATPLQIYRRDDDG